MTRNSICAGCQKTGDTYTLKVASKKTIEVCCNQVRTANWPKKACVEKYFSEHQICPHCGSDFNYDVRYNRSNYPIPQLCAACAKDLERGVALRDVETRGDEGKIENYAFSTYYFTGPAHLPGSHDDEKSIGREIIAAIVDVAGSALIPGYHHERNTRPLDLGTREASYVDASAPLNPRQASSVARMFKAVRKLIVSAYQSGHDDGGNILRQLVQGTRSVESYNEAEMRAKEMK